MVSGREIVETARGYLGAPYKVNGRSRDALDCVGLIILVGNSFGMKWRCKTPTQTESGVAWGTVDATLQRFGFRQIPAIDNQLGDLVVLRVPLGGAATVKIISGVDGLESFFGVSRFINFVGPTFLVETVLDFHVAVNIKRDLRMDVQDYVKRLWRIFRWPIQGLEETWKVKS